MGQEGCGRDKGAAMCRKGDGERGNGRMAATTTVTMVVDTGEDRRGLQLVVFVVVRLLDQSAKIKKNLQSACVHDSSRSKLGASTVIQGRWEEHSPIDR